MFPAYPIPKKEFWVVCHYSGLRFIWSLIHPVKQSKVNDDSYRKPATFPLWIVGIYVAFFGVASQRYENRIDIIENRANAIFTQLGTPVYKKALARIPRVQRLPCPVKPNIKNPLTVWESLFGADTVYTEIVEHLKETVVSWKDTLNQVNLSGADLREAKLDSANLSFADLIGAFLSGADLSEANLSGAILWRANLSGADLSGANLSGAVLADANLSGAVLREADLRGAALRGAAFSGAALSGADLSMADLRFANLREADLSRADLCWAYLIGADLSGANLHWADLIEADLSGANLREAYLSRANLREADLREVKNLTIEQLSVVRTLYKAQLDSTLMEQVEKDHKHLLEEPEYE